MTDKKRCGDECGIYSCNLLVGHAGYHRDGSTVWGSVTPEREIADLRSQLAAAQEEVTRLRYDVRQMLQDLVGTSDALADRTQERDAARADADALRKQVAELHNDAKHYRAAVKA